MQDRLKDHLTTWWSETQQRFREGLYTVTPPPQPPVGIGWWQEAYLQQLAQWEATVNQTLKTEEKLIERWVDQSEPPGAPRPLSLWASQMQGLLFQWMSIQHQLWDEFFSLLRGGAAALREPAIEADLIARECAVVGKAEAGSEPAALPAAPALGERDAVAAVDDLQAIAGIGPATARKLQAAGVTSFRQIALLDPAAIERIETTVIKWPGRIRRDHWIEQAKALHLQIYRETL